MVLELVLEDDAAESDGDGCSQVAREAEGGGADGDVVTLEVGLEGNQWSLKVWPNAYAGNDLVDEDLAPLLVVGKIDEEAEAEGHEAEAEDDGFFEDAGLLDEDTRGRGDEGEDDYHCEEVNTGQDWSGTEDGLEVEWEIVGAADEDEAMTEADAEGGQVGGVAEQT